MEERVNEVGGSEGRPVTGRRGPRDAERPDPKGCRLPTGPDVGNLRDLLTPGEVRRWDFFHRTDLGTTSRLEEIHESGSTHQGSSRMRVTLMSGSEGAGDRRLSPAT